MLIIEYVQLIGAFVFDIEVNDCVRILKTDRSMDVVSYVEDIQTFPMNEEKEVNKVEFLQRLETMRTEVEVPVTDQEEEKMEQDLHIEQIIEDSQAIRQ